MRKSFPPLIALLFLDAPVRLRSGTAKKAVQDSKFDVQGSKFYFRLKTTNLEHGT
jgi:hypothetical protein